MIRRSHAALLAALIAPTAASATGPEADQPPALVVRLVRPDEQLARLLALFDGARAPHPAAALAAWRRATGEHEVPNKAVQAAIALLNPQMVGELRRLDGAAVALEVGAGMRWQATIPRDDGTFAALATALALTDGAAEPPLAGAAVDRLGPAGSPLMARRPDGALAVAPDRDALAVALHALDAPPAVPPDLPSGWHLRLDPAAVPPDAPLAARRVAAGLEASGCRAVEARAAIVGESLTVDVRGAFAGAAPGAAAIDPSWLDAVPSAPAGLRVAAAAALAVGPGRDAWDRLFAVADRVEKADPALAKAAPVRARLDLAALAAGVRPERDLIPHLRGLTAAWLTDPDGRPAGWIVALHAADDAAAERIASRVARPLAARLGAADPVHQDRAVVLASSAAIRDAGLASAAGRAPSEAPALRAAWAGRPAPPARCAVAWPDRLRLDGPLAAGLAGAPPITWAGGADGVGTWDALRWDGLKGVVRRALDRLPQAPDPAGRQP